MVRQVPKAVTFTHVIWVFGWNCADMRPVSSTVVLENLAESWGKWGGSGEGHWGKKKIEHKMKLVKDKGWHKVFLKKVWSFDFKNLEQSGTAGIKTKWEGVVVG